MLLEIESGELTGTATVPTVADNEVEPTEYVRFSIESFPEGNPVDVVGAVTDG
jgi:hypothetical protein